MTEKREELACTYRFADERHISASSRTAFLLLVVVVVVVVAPMIVVVLAVSRPPHSEHFEK